MSQDDWNKNKNKNAPKNKKKELTHSHEWYSIYMYIYICAKVIYNQIVRELGTKFDLEIKKNGRNE